jgi:integrase
MWGEQEGLVVPKDFKRIKTNYPGVFFIEGTSPATGKPEKIFYIRYRKAGKMIEEKAGRQSEDMTPARANQIRAERVQGKSPSRKEARKAAAEIKWTIDRLWQEYSANAPKSWHADRGRFKNHLQTVFGPKEPAGISQIDVHRLRIGLSKTLAPQTVKSVLVLLQRIVNYGVKKGLCTGLGFKIEMPKVNNLKTEDLTPEQLSKLLEALDADHDIQAVNFMRMALVTGMRRSELLKLKWEHLNFDKGFINIINPKGGKDQTIPMNQSARIILENHPRTGSPFVFPGRNGGERTNFTRPINRIRKRAGLPAEFRPMHGLRHTFASMLASSGQVDLYTLQKLLTHKNPAMTQRYAHLRDEALRRASDLAGDLIDQAVNGNSRLKVVKE